MFKLRTSRSFSRPMHYNQTTTHNPGFIEKECKDQERNMQEQTHKINKEWKTVTFSKGRKKNIKSEILESSTKAGINVNIFYTSTGKFLSSQTLSYKARPKTTNLHINMNEKNYTTEEQPQHKINFQTKNHFSALMEEDMVLNKTIY